MFEDFLQSDSCAFWGFMTAVKNNCYSEHLWGVFCLVLLFFPRLVVHTSILYFVMIFFSIPEETNPLLWVYLYFEVPASITGDHDSNCQEVVLSHLLLGDDPHDGPLGGRGAEPVLQLLLLRDALRLLGGGGLVSHGEAAAWEGTKVTAGC